MNQPGAEAKSSLYSSDADIADAMPYPSSMLCPCDAMRCDAGYTRAQTNRPATMFELIVLHS